MEPFTKLHETLLRLSDLDEFSGVVLITCQGRPLFSKAYGYANRAWKIKNNINTRFDTASVTKLFTAVATLQLIGQGVLAFNTRITDIIDLSGTKIPPGVTIYQLLTHSSGIADDSEEEDGELYEDLWKTRPNYMVTTTRDFLPQFAYKEPNFAPGQGCRYCNCGYVLLGLAIEQITGREYRQHIKNAIFATSGMNNTDFLRLDEVNENVAEGYAPIKNEEDQIIGWRKNIYSFPPIGSPDSGALTTVEDMDLFLHAVMQGKLLGREMTAEMLKPQIHYKDGKKYNIKYGYGFEFYYTKNTDLISIQKDGINTGVCACASHYPGLDANLIAFGNYDNCLWKPLDLMEDALLALD